MRNGRLEAFSDWLNCLFLLWLAFIPFPTALMGLAIALYALIPIAYVRPSQLEGARAEFAIGAVRRPSGGVVRVRS